MAAPNWYNRRRGKVEEDVYKLDSSKRPEESVCEILTGLYLRHVAQAEHSPPSRLGAGEPRCGTLRTAPQRSGSDARRISYLNSLVTLLTKEETRIEIGFTTEELMICLRISLVDESIHIRATALRVLRYLIRTESDVVTFNALRLSYLVVRCMDLMLRNELERAQALRVVRRVVAVVGAGSGIVRGARVEQGLLRCLAAVARAGGNAGEGTGDRLSRPAIATLGEIGVLNPCLFIACGGVSAVTRFLQEFATPRMAEALCGVLLHILDAPVSRLAARVDLRCLCAPYCDFNFRPGWLDKNRDEREKRFTCSRLSLLCVLRSWPGVLHFCHPLSDSGLRALVHAGLHLQRLEVRKAILDLLYELLGLPQPEWTDEISVALAAVDPSDFQDSWRLNDGFVAEEGRAILPHLGATGPDIGEIHLSLLLYCFLEAGLLDGLAEVIVTSDTFISVRATILLGQLLHLIHLLLPPEVCSITPPLPSLLSHAAAGKPQALAAIAALQKLHLMLEQRPAASSLFLDHIIQYCSGTFDVEEPQKPKEHLKSQEQPIQEDSLDFLNDIDYEMEQQRHSLGSRSECMSSSVNQSALVKSKSVSSRTSAVVSKVTKTSKLFALFDRESDSLIRDSLVMQNKDGNMWNWEIIRAILKESGERPLLHLADSTHRAWARRVLHYLRPSSNKYSHGDMSGTWHGHTATRAGCQLVRHLLRDTSPDAQRLLEELFLDVNNQVVAILAARTAHECLFSPQHMCNTMCQMYFLFVGQLCHTRSGLKLFHDTGLYKSLLDLSTTTHHSCYVKLVISSLDYTHESYPREILAKTLMCNIDASRLYATQFLNVLLRASQKSSEMMRRKKSGVKRAKGTNRSPYNGDLDASRSPHEDMDTWILRMLVGQLKDESKVVVRFALAILDEACSVPSYLDRLVTMKDTIRQNCGLSKDIDIANPNLGTVGDRGYLLWLHLEVASADKTTDPHSDTLMKRHLEFWTKSYNYRYVRLIDAETHEALTLATEEGSSVRSVGAAGRRSMRGSTAPPNMHAALAQHAAGRQHLATVLNNHYQCIKQARCGSEQEVMDLKASLWALGSAATSHQGVELILALSGGLDDSAFVATVRLAMHCQVYSVRATAFYVLGLMGCTYIGANVLYELGWLCVRHTRHDRFPIIQEENWSSKTESNDELRLRLITSHVRLYDRRIDTETSEQSDQTDASNADSVQFEPNKLTGRNIVTSVTIEHSLTEESCDSDTDKMSTPLKAGRSISESDRMGKNKSQTLPLRGCPVPERSISVSKTVDILREVSFEKSDQYHVGPVSERGLMVGRMTSFDHSHEGRVRNISESSTSGVSSCDSTGRYVFPSDRILTLSPIPSSSSLTIMKGSASRRRLAEVPRRPSVTSYSGPDVASSPPSQKDMAGYAELKVFNQSRRPHLSESAATDVEEFSSMLHDSRRSSRPFSSLRDRSRAAEERSTKRSLLQYDWKPISPADSSSQKLMQLESSPLDDRPSTTRGARPTVMLPPQTDGPCYIGICLPGKLIDIFPTLESTGELPDPSYAVSEAITAESKTSADDINQSLTITKGAGITACIGWMEGAQPWKHDPGTCLACVRQRPPSAHELREAFFASMDSPRAGPSSQSVTERSPAGCAGTGAAGGSLTCTSLELTCSSQASLDCTLSEPHTNVNCEILKHATRMGNPLWHKQAKPALLSIKQKHPEAFQNVCLYSEVSSLLAQGTYMVTARRFLQELFLDTTFECFAAEPQQIVLSHQVSIKPLAEN